MAWNTLLPLALCLGMAGGANILVLSPYTCPSHSNFFHPLVRQLADRGHALTYWNGLQPRSDFPAGVRQLYSEHLRHLNANYDIGFASNFQLLLLMSVPERLGQVCRLCYRDAIFWRLMETSERFDLIVVESFLNECMLPLVHRLRAPFVYLSGIFPSPWLFDVLGNPMSLAHVPILTTHLTDSMDLAQRMWNVFVGVLAVVFRNWIILPAVDRISGQELANLTDLPPVGDIERNVSLLITNSHLSVNYQFPRVAAIVEAGGLHCGPSKPLAQDLEEFVAGSGEAGFIYLSFGSILRGVDLPESTRRAMAEAFGRLPQRVLWKYEGEMDDLPANIRLMPWLPQQDLLGHRHIRLFITHGGLFSLQEAVYHGVPIVGLPVFADQFNNVRKAQLDGYALHLDWNSLTAESLYQAIQTMLHQPKFQQRVRRASELMRDQTEHPLDRAVYWIEYVIRHKGAAHLRTHVRQMAMYQRGLLDVALVLSFLLLAAAYVTNRLVQWSYSRLYLSPCSTGAKVPGAKLKTRSKAKK